MTSSARGRDAGSTRRGTPPRHRRSGPRRRRVRRPRRRHRAPACAVRSIASRRGSATSAAVAEVDVARPAERGEAEPDLRAAGVVRIARHGPSLGAARVLPPARVEWQHPARGSEHARLPVLRRPPGVGVFWRRADGTSPMSPGSRPRRSGASRATTTSAGGGFACDARCGRDRGVRGGDARRGKPGATEIPIGRPSAFRRTRRLPRLGGAAGRSRGLREAGAVRARAGADGGRPVPPPRQRAQGLGPARLPALPAHRISRSHRPRRSRSGSSASWRRFEPPTASGRAAHEWPRGVLMLE